MGRKKLLKLPNLFIGSSKEALDIAIKVAEKLKKNANIKLWNKDVFEISTTSIESLFIQLNESDFGIFIFYPDDTIQMKGKKFKITRDNVIFELGLFMGRLGRERCIIMVPEKQRNLKLPSDLLGVVYTFYNYGSKNAILSEIKKIRKLIKKYGKSPKIIG